MLHLLLAIDAGQLNLHPTLWGMRLDTNFDHLAINFIPQGMFVNFTLQLSHRSWCIRQRQGLERLTERGISLHLSRHLSSAIDHIPTILLHCSEICESTSKLRAWGKKLWFLRLKVSQNVRVWVVEVNRSESAVPAKVVPIVSYEIFIVVTLGTISTRLYALAQV